MTEQQIRAAGLEFAALAAIIRDEFPVIGDIRPCPCGCGRSQHYTGAEHGWALDAKASL